MSELLGIEIEKKDDEKDSKTTEVLKKNHQTRSKTNQENEKPNRKGCIKHFVIMLTNLLIKKC